MKHLTFLVLLTLLGCSVPVAEGWRLNVRPGEHSGELLTWGFVPRSVESDLLAQVEELYYADRREIALRRTDAAEEPRTTVCQSGQKRIFQRDDYTEYFRDDTRLEKVYAGCGPDSGEEEYWRALCVAEEEAEKMVDNHCFRHAAPDNKHCRFGRLAFLPSFGRFVCVEKEEIVAEARDFCDGEVGLLRVGEVFFGVCFKLQDNSLRERVHVARFIRG